MARLRYAALAIGSQGVSRMVPRLTLQQVAPGLACLLDYKSQWWSADLRAGLSVAAVALPVAIAYRTAVARGGKVYFFPDIYGHDAELSEALRKVAGPLRPARRPAEGAAGSRRPAA